MSATEKQFSFQLPPKILHLVFKECLRLKLPFQVLFDVSKQWRAVALEIQSQLPELLPAAVIPGLNPLELSNGPIAGLVRDDKSDLITHNGMCSKKKLEVEIALERKELLPTIEVYIAILLKPIDHAITRNITFLCVIVNHELAPPTIHSPLRDAFSGTLPCLESLVIASTQAVGNLYESLEPLMEIVEESAVKLKSLCLKNVHQDFITKAGSKSFWERLSSITIKNEFEPFNAMLLNIPPNLEELSIPGELVATPILPTTSNFLFEQPIRLRNLETLHVGRISMNTLSRFHLPQLQTLTIGSVHKVYPSPSPSLCSLLLPSLKVLQIETINPSIACISAPQLETLCLSIPALKQSAANHVLDSIFHGGDEMLRPKRLALGGPVHDKHLISALKSMGDKLVSLKLDSQMSFSKTFWMEMTPRATRREFKVVTSSLATTTATDTSGPGSAPHVEAGSNRAPLLLPNLQCLLVDVHRSPLAMGEGRQMRVLLRKLIDSRRADENYASFLRVGCKWREECGLEDMVDPSACVCCAKRKEQLA